MYLNANEELLLTIYQQKNIQDICFHYGFPMVVIETASLFHKRFFLSKSLLEYESMNVMLASVFLSCKLNNIHVVLDSFLKPFPKIKHDQILDLELLICKIVEFNFNYELPYLIFYGMYLNLQRFVSDKICLEEIYADGKALILQSYLTDCILLFKAADIASTAFCCACNKHGIPMQNRHTEVLAIFESKIVLDKQKLKEMDKKLYFCRKNKL